MANVWLKSERLTLAVAGRLLGFSPSTLFRWCRDGCRGVKLDYCRIGGKIFTTAEALEEFATRLREVDDLRFAKPVPSRPRRQPTRAAISQDEARSRRELSEAGIL